MGITMQEVIDNELISKELIESLPNDGYCECESELEFTDSLRQVYCTNSKCYLKIAARLEDMAKTMEAEGWDKETCVKVCKDFKLQTPYQIFLLEKSEYNGVADFKDKIESICDSNKRKFKLWQVVSLVGIPNIDNTAYKIFEGYGNLTEAYEDIEKYQVPFIADKLGLKNADTGVMAVTIYNNLMEFKSELMFGEKKFQVHNIDSKKIQIAINGSIKGFANKSAFVNYINMKYDGRVRILLMNSVVSNIDVLINDGDNGSIKYKTAQRLNEKAKEKAAQGGIREWHEIKIIESEKYLEYLDELYGDTE